MNTQIDSAASIVNPDVFNDRWNQSALSDRVVSSSQTIPIIVAWTQRNERLAFTVPSKLKISSSSDTVLPATTVNMGASYFDSILNAVPDSAGLDVAVLDALSAFIQPPTDLNQFGWEDLSASIDD